MNALPWTIYFSFAGAALSLLAGSHSAAVARRVALVTALAGSGAALLAASSFVSGPGLQTIVNVPWIPELGIRFHLAADGISMTLIILTGIAATAGVLFSWNIEERVGEFFALYFALIGGVYGVFLSADAFVLFVFYEIAIVPKYFLIANWGSTNREYGAMKLVLYSFAGSALVLAGLLWAYAAGGGQSFALGDLARAATNFSRPDQLAMFAPRLPRVCRARGHVPLPHLGAHWPRRGAHRRIDAARRRRDETRRLWLPARGHAAVPRRAGVLAAGHRDARHRGHPLRGPRRARAG
jgi:NADH-quinone oxidoreductase subunit M